MNLEIRPILATLRRHKTAASLIVLQVALTCAIVCNALFLIMQRVDRINEPTGLADDQLVALAVAGVAPSQNAEAQTREDLAALRAVPGVQAVSLLNQIPFGQNFSMSTLRHSDDEKASGVGAAHYNVREGWLETTGLRLIAGRDFEPSDYVDGEAFQQSEEAVMPAVILTRRTAERMFPGQQAVGQKVYGLGKGASQVVGVVEHLVSPQPGSDQEIQRYAMLVPERGTFRGGMFLLRTSTAQRDEVRKAAAAALERSGPGRILLRKQLFTEMREKFYAADRNMVRLLIGVCVALMVVTAFGIVGLASFWVQQRTRMIGTRRALGATRGDIQRYFQTENLLLSGTGVLLGMVAALGISLLLMQRYEMPRLPLFYLPISALVLALLGQLAVLVPARRAAALPPVAALRS